MVCIIKITEQCDLGLPSPSHIIPTLIPSKAAFTAEPSRRYEFFIDLGHSFPASFISPVSTFLQASIKSPIFTESRLPPRPQSSLSSRHVFMLSSRQAQVYKPSGNRCYEIFPNRHPKLSQAIHTNQSKSKILQYQSSSQYQSTRPQSLTRYHIFIGLLRNRGYRALLANIHLLDKTLHHADSKAQALRRTDKPCQKLTSPMESLLVPQMPTR